MKGVGWWKGKLPLVGGDEQYNEGVILSTARKTWNMKIVIINLRFRMKKPAFV